MIKRRVSRLAFSLLTLLAAVGALQALSAWHATAAEPLRVVCLPVVVTSSSALNRLTLAPGVTVPLVYVPAGTFLMGADEQDADAEPDERPQHAVYLDAYWIGRYELTVGEWRAFVDATGYQGDVRALQGPDNYPVRWISWDDCDSFCDWASLVTGRVVHLPTEAQWEKAARGVDGRKFPWGNNPPFCGLCNLHTCVRDASPVGSCSPLGDSVYGCADMAGNLWEWTFDYYDWDYYKVSPSVNPTGPTSGYYRGARGGAWSYPERDVRCSNRHRVDAPFARDEYVGFRLAVASE